MHGPPANWKVNRGLLEMFVRDLAINRLLQIDFSIPSFQEKQGTFPRTLDELIPDFLPTIPLDPYTNLPFIDRPSDNDFLLYSVGKNRRDDNANFTNFDTYVQSEDAAAGFDLDVETLLRP